MGDLEGRVAIITGAGRGIGREHALLLAAEGAAVVVNDLGGGTDGEGASKDPATEVVAEIEAAGGIAMVDGSDVATADGADHLITAAIGTFGRIDVLVNNAGMLRDRTIVSMSDDDWDLSIGVNLRGHFMPTRAAARYWREESKRGATVAGSVINTSSESGIFGNAGQANYAAAKAGVAALTEVASKELSRYGVRVNAILPRARTRLTDGLVPPARADAFDKWDAANVSPFVAYLGTTRCAINGQVFLVGGGLVQRAAPWSLDPGWCLESEGRWTVRGLAEAVDKTGVPENVGRLTGHIR
jgi:NAD(P)-dependent dehydrogenase (short-subunit alcohol dehydrogenase family)